MAWARSLGWGLEEKVASSNLTSPSSRIGHNVLIPFIYLQASNRWVHFSWSVHSVTLSFKGKT